MLPDVIDGMAVGDRRNPRAQLRLKAKLGQLLIYLQKNVLTDFLAIGIFLHESPDHVSHKAPVLADQGTECPLFTDYDPGNQGPIVCH
jgi:hypothetical protein